MRIFSVVVLLMAIGGCSSQTLTVNHILPVNYSGVYVIQKGQDDSSSYKVDGERYVLEIPESGILKVTPDVFENYCTDLCSKKIVLTASFSDGTAIPMYSPLSPPANSESDNQLLHGILGTPDCIWYAVGNYKQLKEFSEKYWKELPEKVKFYKYGGLEEYLPPNMPFQTDEQAGTD